MNTEMINTNLVDPLSEVTRKERRMLLGISILAIFFAATGVSPTHINALGIEFESSERHVFLYVLASIVLYFIAAFFIYALSDFIVWRKSVVQEHLKLYQEYIKGRDRWPNHPDDIEYEKEESNIYNKNKIWFSLTISVSISRAVFEFLLPILVGITAFLWLIANAICHT